MVIIFESREEISDGYLISRMRRLVENTGQPTKIFDADERRAFIAFSITFSGFPFPNFNRILAGGPNGMMIVNLTQFDTTRINGIRTFTVDDHPGIITSEFWITSSTRNSVIALECLCCKGTDRHH